MCSVNLRSYPVEKRAKLSAITRSASEREEVIELLTDKVEQLLEDVPNPTPVEQLTLVLDHVGKKAQAPGYPVMLETAKDYPLFFAQTPDAMKFLLESAIKAGYLRRDASTEFFTLMMPGHEYLESKRKDQAAASMTRWPKIDRALKDVQDKLLEAETEDHFKSIGHACREALITLARSVYDAEKHPPVDDKTPGWNDAKRMLEPFIEVECPGSSRKELRSLVRKAVSFANEVAHDENADYVSAAVCLETTGFLARIVSILATKGRA